MNFIIGASFAKLFVCSLQGGKHFHTFGLFKQPQWKFLEPALPAMFQLYIRLTR